jgi:hypothetical protein
MILLKRAQQRRPRNPQPNDRTLDALHTRYDCMMDETVHTNQRVSTIYDLDLFMSA